MSKKENKRVAKELDHLVKVNIEIGDFTKEIGLENDNIASLKVAVAAYSNARKTIVEKINLRK